MSAEPSPAADTSRLVLVVRDVAKFYEAPGHRVVALDGVNLSVRQGEFVAIMGASGSGKSTLLHLIGGLTAPSNGSIQIEDTDLAQLSDRQRTLFRRRRMGVIFQEFNLLPTLTARENIALPWLVDGRNIRGMDTQLDQLLATVHLQARADHRPDALSGGEQQRVAIARALSNEPAIVLADEPTGNLDSKQSHEIWQLLRVIAAEQQRTIVMVTHEAPGAAFAHRVVVLKDGRVVGEFNPEGPDDATLVATRYQELAG